MVASIIGVNRKTQMILRSNSYSTVDCWAKNRSESRSWSSSFWKSWCNLSLCSMWFNLTNSCCWKREEHRCDCWSEKVDWSEHT